MELFCSKGNETFVQMAQYWLTDVLLGHPVSDKTGPCARVSPLPPPLTCHSDVDAAHPHAWRRHSVASAVAFISCLRYFYPPPPENSGPVCVKGPGGGLSRLWPALSFRWRMKTLGVRKAGQARLSSDRQEAKWPPLTKICSSCWAVDISGFLAGCHLGSQRCEVPPCGWLRVLHFCTASLHFSCFLMTHETNPGRASVFSMEVF